MNRKHLTTAGWLALSVGSFALGWALKPGSSSGGASSAPEHDTRKQLTALASDPAATPEPTGPGSTSKSLELAGGTDLPSPWLATGRKLTASQISDFGELFRKELDPLKRRAAFLQLMDGLTVENAKMVREQIAALPANSPAFRDFHYEWGKIAGADAVMHGAETEKPDMLAALAGWVSADPQAASDWYASLEKTSKDSYANQDYLKMGMVHGLANADPGLATAFVLEHAAGGDKSARQMIGIIAQKIQQVEGPAEAARWAASLPSDELRGPAMGHAASTYATSDPEGAAEWARSVADRPGGSHAVGVVSRQLARRDAPAAVEWLESLGDSPASHSGYHAAFESWAGNDPAAASQRLVEMPPSRARDFAISGLVSRTRWEDPHAAITWANEIAEPQRRETALVTAGQAFMHRNRSAAQEWLANSGLSEQAQKRITGGK